MVPVFGEVFDLADAGISYLRGDYIGASLSMAAMIPGIGNVAGAGKLANRAAKLTVKQRYANAVEEATKRYRGNVTVQRGDYDLFRVHQPDSGHGSTVEQIVWNVNPKTGEVFENERKVPVRRSHVKKLERALKGDPRYSLRTRGGRK